MFAYHRIFERRIDGMKGRALGLVQMLEKGMRRLLCAALLLLVLVASVAAAHGDTVRFAVLGDRTGSHVPGAYEQIVTEVERLKPDFVVTVGDMIQGYEDDPARLEPQWEEYKSIVSDLSMPIYFTPGNHDISNDGAEEPYRRHIGEPYHSFDVGSLHFVVLDTSRWSSSTSLPSVQLDWLARDLEKNRDAGRTFVLFHKPFWYGTVSDGKPGILHKRFSEFGVDAVFTGHLHEYFSAEYDGILYTSVGRSGAGSHPGLLDIGYNFVWVTVDEKGVSISPVKTGAVLPWDEVTVSKRKLIEEISRSSIQFENAAMINEKLAVPSTEVVVRVNNLSTDSVIEDVLRWEVPRGWSVKPESLPVKVMAGESTTVVFKVRNRGNINPRPVASLHVPVLEGKTLEVSKPLEVRMDRETVCPRVNTPPRIDGKLDDAAWRKSPGIKEFLLPDGSARAGYPTRVRLAYDTRNLYMSFHCSEPEPGGLVTEAGERDGPAWEDDSIEIFLDTGLDRKTYYQYAINADGTVYDGIGFDASWDGPCTAAVGREDRAWTMEVAVPWKVIGVTEPRPGMRLGLEIVRNRMQQPNERSMWSPTFAGNHEPSRFGVLVLGGR